jgi:hypothetical protein
LILKRGAAVFRVHVPAQLALAVLCAAAFMAVLAWARNGSGGSDTHVASRQHAQATQAEKTHPALMIYRLKAPSLTAEADPPTVPRTPSRLCRLVDATDPTATGTALRRAGYRVRWTLVTFHGAPTTLRDVPRPPTGTQILSVLDEQGEPPSGQTMRLGIELFRPDDPGAGGEPPGQGLFCQ